MDSVKCDACGQCCKKHWLVKLIGRHEKEFFKDQLVIGEYMWVDECPHFKENKCLIFGQEIRPYKCKKYYCEKKNS